MLLLHGLEYKRLQSYAHTENDSAHKLDGDTHDGGPLTRSLYTTVLASASSPATRLAATGASRVWAGLSEPAGGGTSTRRVWGHLSSCPGDLVCYEEKCIMLLSIVPGRGLQVNRTSTFVAMPAFRTPLCSTNSELLPALNPSMRPLKPEAWRMSVICCSVGASERESQS